MLSQRITTTMHATTHIDAPAHVVQGTPFIDEVPLPHFFAPASSWACRRRSGSSSPAMIWKRPRGHAIRPGDVLIINTGWHKQYEDGDYFAYCPWPSCPRLANGW